ncbi:MAG: hypothetical protein JAZ15_15725, partial [Candidatus Thiodiazotropha endolucinida]|nr:hypothetical protein [Candidatus Thiodiazotropha taylori]MCW4314468.1 hypothetical protein [Candidatus Thiodiazotropha taylori]
HGPVLERPVLGQPYWGMSKQTDTHINEDVIPNNTGIIEYHADFDGTKGNFDLWDGGGFIGPGNFNDMKTGFDIALWRVD